MALTSFPTLVFNTGTGSDSNASGAGPGTAVTGTTNAVTASTTVTFAGAPDLSGVAQDGTAVLWVSGVGFVRISTVDNVAKSCVVETALTCSAGTAFAIGGKRATFDNTESRRLFAATSSPTALGATGQWTLQLEDDQAITSTITLAFTAGTGYLTIQSDGSTRRVISCNASGAAIFTCNTANRARFKTCKFQHTHATVKGYAFTHSSTTVIECRDCICGDSGGTNCPSGISTRTGGGGTVILWNTSVLRCGSIGINGTTQVYLYGSEISRCGGAGVSISGGELHAHDSIISHNSGDGINTANLGGSNTFMEVKNCTIHGNSGDGIELTGNNVVGAMILNNSITANGGYGLKFSGTTPHFGVVEYNNFGNASDSTNNTSGAASGWTLSSTNLTATADYTDASSGVRNFKPGNNHKAAGFPASSAVMAAGQTGSTSYVDIGAVQRQEPTPATPAWAMFG